jgi:integrase
VLPLQWQHVDFEAHVVRLDPHTTKNDEGRTFPFTDALQELLEAQKAEHDRLKAEEVLCPWVFHRTGKKVKGKRITLHEGLEEGMRKSRISGSHSARRATYCRSESRTRRHSRTRGDAVDRPQDALGVRALQHRERV